MDQMLDSVVAEFIKCAFGYRQVIFIRYVIHKFVAICIQVDLYQFVIRRMLQEFRHGKRLVMFFEKIKHTFMLHPEHLLFFILKHQYTVLYSSSNPMCSNR